MNLLCGATASVFALRGGVVPAVFFIFCAAIFDFADGFAARMLRSVSEFGKQLDSLSDLISFGFAPAAIMVNHIAANNVVGGYGYLLPLLLTVCAGIRLAVFNIDTSQSVDFRGLPTPAVALTICSMFMPARFSSFNTTAIVNSPIMVIGLVVILSLLMVSHIRFMSLKIAHFTVKGMALQLLLLVVAVVLIVIFGLIGIAFAMAFYLILSIFKNYIFKTRKK